VHDGETLQLAAVSYKSPFFFKKKSAKTEVFGYIKWLTSEMFHLKTMG